MKYAYLALAAIGISAAPAQAGEIYGGVYVHDVDTIFTKSGYESGADIHLGFRGDKIGRTRLQPYIFGSVNTAGETNYAAVGLSAKFGQRTYFRPGLGIGVHTGSAGNFERTDKIAFGSRVLFQPEVNVGYQVNDRFSIEASWVHMSHAQIFGKQNPGMDNFGVRLNYGL